MDTNQVQHKVEGRSFVLDAQSAPKDNKQFLTGSLDHVAFSLELNDFEQYKARLDKAGLMYKEGHDLDPIAQLWVLDANGIKVELNFT